MLNLSDKELDRLSQEAAQHHEPGDIVGPRLWEKLEVRLDRDLGRVNPNPAHGIRRLPFYYAPAMLVLIGISYYLVRLNHKSHTGSGSPPLSLIKPAPTDSPAGANSSTSSSPNPKNNNINSTPGVPKNTVSYPGTAGSPAAGAAGSSNPAADAGTGGTTNAAASTAGPSIVPGTKDNSATANTSANISDNSATGGTTNNSTTANSTTTPTANSGTTSYPGPASRRRHNTRPGSTAPAAPGMTGSPDQSAAANITTPSTAPGATTTAVGTTTTSSDATTTSSAAAAPTAGTTTTATPATPRALTLARVRGPVRLTHPVSIDDSALRAFNIASIRQPITRKGGLHINRSLEIGFQGAPDFASVNSVAGDRAGSSFGLTVDYKFADRWYLGSGLLITRKNYAAAPQDFHVPDNYYQNHGMNNVQYIKGTFNMLEVPLDLRYDFSTTGNTLFFASVGTSSYFLTSENCSYYYNLFGRQGCQQFRYSNKPDYLFSAIDLSLGVETGLSNSLSLLIAPYVKIPTRNMGFGQVQLNSFGIDFALKFAPVLSRRR